MALSEDNRYSSELIQESCWGAERKPLIEIKPCFVS